MQLAVAALSHAPSFGNVDPGGTTLDEIKACIQEVRAFIEHFDPEAIVVFGPDHLNGQLYSNIAPWVIGAQAEGVGDYGTTEGHINVDGETARQLHAAVLAQGIDIARSERMTVDHGVMQPVDFLLGRDNTRPIIPVFVNAIAHPLPPMKRVREMGEAFGKAALQLGKRVLFIASGGISHSPPIPRWESAPAEVKARLVTYAPTREERGAREKAIVDGIQKIADGKAPSLPLNEAWDTLLLDTFRSGDLSPVDSWDNEQFIIDGGSAAHEMRSWIAAYAALSMSGKYKLPVDRYWAVKTWGAGFAVQAGSVA